MNWKRGSKEKEDAAQRMNSSKKSCLKIGALFVNTRQAIPARKISWHTTKGAPSSKGDRLPD